MINKNNAPMDFDPRADYLGETRNAELAAVTAPEVTDVEVDPVAVAEDEATRVEVATRGQGQVTDLRSGILETLRAGREGEISEQDRKDAAYVVERSFKDGYKDVKDINSLFDEMNLTPEQRKTALLDGIASKLTVGRSYPVPEINYLMESFGLTKEDFVGTEIQRVAINILDGAIERELARGADNVDENDVTLSRAVLNDSVVDSRIRNLFDARKKK